jgi:beta-glucosidase/6-phospho-beta-glucosidase/beta-galactosidase
MIILQYEGAYLNDGKGLSDWDVLTHETPGDYDDDNELYLYTNLNRFLVPTNNDDSELYYF